MERLSPIISAPMRPFSMKFSSALALAFCFQTYGAAPSSAKKSIDWFSCNHNSTLPLTCGTLNVPLDYTNASSDATLKLDLVKVDAVKKPKQGTILLNPGGPGLSGRGILAWSEGGLLQIATGGAYDLIGFDTRYVIVQCCWWGYSIPRPGMAHFQFLYEISNLRLWEYTVCSSWFLFC